MNTSQKIANIFLLSGVIASYSLVLFGLNRLDSDDDRLKVSAGIELKHEFNLVYMPDVPRQDFDGYKIVTSANSPVKCVVTVKDEMVNDRLTHYRVVDGKAVFYQNISFDRKVDCGFPIDTDNNPSNIYQHMYLMLDADKVDTYLQKTEQHNQAYRDAANAHNAKVSENISKRAYVMKESFDGK